ncbi:MAG: uracil-DNA glycosylase [bacterium]|nr:uracil-DNA glycosylase [bacterium]
MDGAAPEPDEISDPLAEARALTASAAALVRELVEEDLVGFERLPDLPGADATEPTAAPPAPAAASAAPAAPKSPRPDVAPPVEIGAPVPWAGRQPTLTEVETHLGDCQRCGLCEGRSRIVFGDGNPNADLLFIGEGPGAEEDKRGLPFVGRAGELLTQMIEKGIGIARSEVYICNIVKCRPPRNRTPLPPEVAACRPFLDGQIEAIRPKVIVTLGKPAASLLLDREIAITRLRGTWQDYRGIPMMPTLHPAYVLRQYTPENRRAVWEDLKAAWDRVQP